MERNKSEMRAGRALTVSTRVESAGGQTNGLKSDEVPDPKIETSLEISEVSTVNIASMDSTMELEMGDVASGARRSEPVTGDVTGVASKEPVTGDVTSGAGMELGTDGETDGEEMEPVPGDVTTSGAGLEPETGDVTSGAGIARTLIILDPEALTGGSDPNLESRSFPMAMTPADMTQQGGDLLVEVQTLKTSDDSRQQPETAV
jgi:hypothetical protein